MAGELPGDPSHEMIRDGACSPGEYGFSWYLSRKEIENNSPSRKDGIDQRKESRLRMLYCSFLQDIGMKLVVPQVTIATATMFCHRFYLHQSHAKNEWQTIATVCMFLASKVEETPRPLDKVIVVAYTMMYRKDSAAARRIYQKDIFEKQKALILIGERLLLSTIRFDFNIQHPYKPLVEACKKFGYTQKEVMRVAWNFVNDWLRTTLCLQYKSHYIAAGSLLLAAKLQNVKLPSERGSIWWHAFDVAPRQLEEVIQHMMELLGYKNGGVVKPSHPPLSMKKEATPSSLDCVPSRPGSSGGSPRHESDGEACKSRVKDSANCNSTCSWKQDNESPNSVVEDGERPGSAEPDRATDGAGKIDVDRIKAMIKRRKQEMEDNKPKGGIGDSGEEAWIERELESGIELGFEPPSEKRQRWA